MTTWHDTSGGCTRVQPHLGTLVNISLQGLPTAQGHRAAAQGFAAIATVHRLMSFHQPDSDVSRMNRQAHRRPVRVNAATMAVLQAALRMSLHSAGAFDVTVGRQAVLDGRLPWPAGTPFPAAGGDWRDIEVLDEERVRFHRPLWVDFGGIAKGYAVDEALQAMALPPQVQVCINAGGDLRVQGPLPQRVLLADAPGERLHAALEVQSASVASSVFPRRGSAAAHGELRISVVAPTCMVADALTKVVLAHGERAAAVLAGYGATAYVFGESGSTRLPAVERCSALVH